jgi:uncharacterized membrane protein YkvA (DUF1232 family)
MSKGLRIALSVVIGAVAVAYGASPVDLIPELFTGPIGLLDDGGVIAAAIFGIWKLLTGGRQQKDVGGTEPQV